MIQNVVHHGHIVQLDVTNDAIYIIVPTTDTTLRRIGPFTPAERELALEIAADYFSAGEAP